MNLEKHETNPKSITPHGDAIKKVIDQIYAFHKDRVHRTDHDGAVSRIIIATLPAWYEAVARERDLRSHDDAIMSGTMSAIGQMFLATVMRVAYESECPPTGVALPLLAEMMNYTVNGIRNPAPGAVGVRYDAPDNDEPAGNA